MFDLRPDSFNKPAAAMPLGAHKNRIIDSDKSKVQSSFSRRRTFAGVPYSLYDDRMPRHN